MSIESIVSDEINKIKIIDLHTHLFPANQDELFLYGFDNLMTYHYLIAELFMFYDEISPDKFYNLTKKQQADIIWNELFVKRSPISEASRGVLTTCKILGIPPSIGIDNIRESFNQLTNYYGKEGYIKEIFDKSNVEYTIMTNQIFNRQEINLLKNNCSFPSYFKTSLRVDEIIFNINKCYEFIEEEGYSPNIEGIKNYIKFWNKKLNPEYFMASIPYDFKFDEDNSNYGIENVLVPLSLELDLPIAFKFGTQRKLNPILRDAGDGAGESSVESLSNLCRKFNKTKFLATFLSQVNQHQLCVVARKFGNLHIYGCWWFLNNPSLIEQITTMRIEMLGLGFTAQHSDSRILEQLLYKWKHSREIIKKVLIKKYNDIKETGWKLNENQIRKDIWYLFRGSYQEFINKKLN